MKYFFGCLIFILTVAVGATSGNATSSRRTLEYSPDGKLLLVRLKLGFHVISAKDGTFRYSWKASRRFHIETFSADSKSIILAHAPKYGPDRQATLEEIGTAGGVEFTYTPPSPFQFPYTLAASRSSDLFLTAHADGDAQIWRRGVSAPERSFQDAEIMDALFGPGEGKITIIQSRIVTVRDLSTWEKTASFIADEYDGFAEGMFTKNERSILIGLWNFYDRYNVYSLDAESLAFRALYFKNMSNISVGLNTLATCLPRNDKVAIRKFSMEIKSTVKLPYACAGVALSPDSRQLITVDPGSTRIDAWNVKTGKPAWSIKNL